MSSSVFCLLKTNACVLTNESTVCRSQLVYNHTRHFLISSSAFNRKSTNNQSSRSGHSQFPVPLLSADDKERCSWLIHGGRQYVLSPRLGSPHSKSHRSGIRGTINLSRSFLLVLMSWFYCHCKKKNERLFLNFTPGQSAKQNTMLSAALWRQVCLHSSTEYRYLCPMSVSMSVY